ncbi:MAG: sodium:calcium antiporter [Actinomycetales bacterium]|nr:sodium:calcium antiporter [Actinomycetales bacterium]
MPMGAWLALFAVAAALVALGGIQLARYGDLIAERANLSRLFVGMLLVAGATSLPEILTAVSASLNGAPDLAVGDLFGAGMANMATLAVIDLLHRHRVWPSVEIEHARVASVAITLVAIAVLGILVPRSPALGRIGVDTLLIAGTYIAAVAWMRRSPASRFAGSGIAPVPTGWSEPRPGGLRQPVTRFALAAAVIFLAAPLLARAGEEIAALSGIGQTFVGSAFVAMTTSLPEFVAALAAARLGSYDLAVGNLFGSNAFNMAILVLADAAYADGPVLAAVDQTQALAGVGAILLMAYSMTAIVHGLETRIRRLEPDAVVLLMLYGAMLAVLWWGRP